MKDNATLHFINENPEQKNSFRCLRQAIAAFVIGVVLAFLNFTSLMPPITTTQGQTGWLVLAIFTVIMMIYSAGDIYRTAWQALLIRTANINTLIALGTGALWLYSFFVVILPQLFPDNAQATYFDSVLLIISFIKFASAIEMYVRAKTRLALQHLIELNPSSAHLIKHAQHAKPPIAQLAETDASFMVPSVLIIALITAAIWFYLGPEPKIAFMFITCVSVLIIACPRALRLSSPISITIAVDKAAEHGILIRRSEALQKAQQLTTIVLNKADDSLNGSPDFKAGIEHLQKMGLTIVLLPGISPEETAKKIAELQAQGNIVAMVGERKEDAPALAQADVGFLLGTNTEESADLILIHPSLKSVWNAIDISKATVRNIKQNRVGASFYHLITIPVAAGAFYPLFGILIDPMIAGALVSLSSIAVVMNAARLRRMAFSD